MSPSYPPEAEEPKTSEDRAEVMILDPHDACGRGEDIRMPPVEDEHGWVRRPRREPKAVPPRDDEARRPRLSVLVHEDRAQSVRTHHRPIRAEAPRRSPPPSRRAHPSKNRRGPR